MMPHKQHTSEDEQTRQRNKVRGVLGEAVRRHSDTGKLDRNAIYRRGIRTALLEARNKLFGEERDRYFNWLDALANAGGADIGRAVALEPDNSIIRSRRLSFAEEFDWIIRRTKPYVLILRSFRSRAEALNAAFWRGDQTAVWSELGEIEREFGVSLWLIETRIALEQYYNGLEPQKGYAATLRREYYRGLPAYVAYFVSIRNEPRSTLHRHNSDFRSKIENTKLSLDAKTYLKYRLSDEFNGTEREVSAILRVEQAQSIVDLYETAIDLFQKLAAANKLARYEVSLRNTLPAWSEIEDYRIAKLLSVLGFGRPPTNGPFRSPEVSTRLLDSHSGPAYRAALKRVRCSPNDAWAGIESACCISMRQHVRRLRDGSPWQFVTDRLSVLLNRTKDFEQARADLIKFARNLQTLPTGKAILDFVKNITTPFVERSALVASPCLNSPYWGWEDASIARGDAYVALRQALTTHGGSRLLDLWTASSPVTDWPVAAAALHAYIAGRSELRMTGGTSNMRGVTHLLAQPLPRPIDRALSLLAIDMAVANDDVNAAVTLISTEVASCEAARSIVPIGAAIGGRSWQELNRVTDKLALAISLDVLLRRTNDDTIATFLRFAFDEYLTSLSLDRPSDICTPTAGVRQLQTIYFLRNICIPSIMDMFAAFRGSRDLEEERILICEKLCELDPGRRSEYELESNTLKNRLLIQDGLKLVDSSRIYADTGAISRLAEQTHAESFARYRALVGAGIGVAEDLDTVLRAIGKAPEQGGDFFNVPENEADNTLLEILIALRREFLNNTSYGLNFYLSKRIRHGTIAGYLRSPIERAFLITQRESETTPYKPNEHWLSRLTFYSIDMRSKASEHFAKFAAEIDGLIKDVKDEYLQIKGKEHPRGMFDIIISAPRYHLIRSAIQRDLTFRTFLQNCFGIFWVLLEPSLEMARSLLVVHTKTKITRAFDALYETIRSCADQNESFRIFSSTLRDTSAEVQRQLDMMSDWFRRTEGQQASHRFSFEEVVNIAIESALKVHKGFRPKITNTFVGSHSYMTTSILVIIADILSILFDNIFRYARAGDEPRVFLNFTFDASTDMIQIAVVNEAAKAARSVLVESRLALIRQHIADRSFRGQVQREGGSGFLKIASFVLESRQGMLEFGFQEDGDFAVRVAFPVVTTGPDSPVATATGDGDANSLS